MSKACLTVRELRQKLFAAPGGFLVETVSGQGLQAPQFDDCTGLYLVTNENEDGAVGVKSVVLAINGHAEEL